MSGVVDGFRQDTRPRRVCSPRVCRCRIGYVSAGSVSLKNETVIRPAIAFLRSAVIGMKPGLKGHGRHRREGLALRL